MKESTAPKIDKAFYDLLVDRYLSYSIDINDVNGSFSTNNEHGYNYSYYSERIYERQERQVYEGQFLLDGEGSFIIIMELAGAYPLSSEVFAMGGGLPSRWTEVRFSHVGQTA